MSNFGDLVSKIISTDEVCNHDRSEAGNFPCKFHRGHYAIKPMNELLALIRRRLNDISYWAKNDEGLVHENIHIACDDIEDQIRPISKRDNIAKHKIIYHMPRYTSNFEDLVNEIISTDEVCNHHKSKNGKYPCEKHRGHYAIKPMNELLALINRALNDISYWAENDRGSVSKEIDEVCDNIRSQIVAISKRDDIAKHKIIYHNTPNKALRDNPLNPRIMNDSVKFMLEHGFNAKEVFEVLGLETLKIEMSRPKEKCEVTHHINGVLCSGDSLCDLCKESFLEVYGEVLLEGKP